MLEERPSKTKVKKAMHELQQLGTQLLALPESQLSKMALPQDLLDALTAAHRINSREARRRQLQYIGRLMRETDVEPIRERLAEIAGVSSAASARHRRLEQWRARLLEDDAALTEYAAQHPQADLQALRTQIRNARREQSLGQPPRAFRELFRLLREANTD